MSKTDAHWLSVAQKLGRLCPQTDSCYESCLRLVAAGLLRAETGSFVGCFALVVS